MKLRCQSIDFTPFIALILSLVIGGIVIFASGYPPLQAYAILFKGSLGSKTAVLQTLLKSTPLIFAGLAVAVGFKGGLFNVGVEGQIYMGAMLSSLAAVYFPQLGAALHLTLSMLAGILGGALWAYLPAILKIKRGAHEVVTTIMLNYLAILFTNYLVNYPLKAPGMVPQTLPILHSAEIPRIFPRSQLSWAILIAILVVLVLHYIIKNTTFGYQLTVTGANPSAAEAGGIKTTKMQLTAMLLSGAIAGLGGSMEILGTHRRFIQGFSPGYGYDGIAVAVLGGNSPLGVLASSLLFGALRAGGAAMDRLTVIPSDFVFALQGIVILIISAPKLCAILKPGGIKKWTV